MTTKMIQHQYPYHRNRAVARRETDQRKGYAHDDLDLRVHSVAVKKVKGEEEGRGVESELDPMLSHRYSQHFTPKRRPIVTSPILKGHRRLQRYSNLYEYALQKDLNAIDEDFSDT